MKRVVCLIAVLSLLLTLAGCYTEPGSTIRWTLEDGVLTVRDSKPLSTPDPYSHNHDVVRDEKWNELTNEIHTVRLDSSVTAIGSGAFAAMPMLESVEWSDRLAYIGSGAFSGSALKLETLPKSLLEIGKAAFSGCGNLKHIFYAGTREQFEMIEGSEKFITDYGGWLVCETPAP